MYYLLSLSAHGSEMAFFHERYYSSSVDIRWGLKNIVPMRMHKAKFFLVLNDCDPFEIWAPWDESYKNSGTLSDEYLDSPGTLCGGAAWPWYNFDPQPRRLHYANHLPGYIRWEQFYQIAVCDARQFLSARNYRFQKRKLELDGATYTVLTIMDSQYVFTGNGEYIGKFGFREIRTWNYTGRVLPGGARERLQKKQRQLTTLHVNSAKPRLPWNEQLQSIVVVQTSWRGAVRTLVDLREQL